MSIYAMYTKIYWVSFVKIGTRKATEHEPVNLFSAALTLCNVPNTATQWSTPHSKGSGFETSPDHLQYGMTVTLYAIKKVKWSRYRPGVAQSVGRGIALLYHDRGTRRGWVVSSTPRAHFTPGKDPVPILQEAGWAPGTVWTGGKSRPRRDSIPDRPARSQSLYWLSYPAHTLLNYSMK